MTQPPPVPPIPTTSTPTMSPADERMWATLTHVGGIFTLWLVPLIAYLVLKDRGPFVRWHTRQALNFHITMVIAYAAGFLLTIIIVGFVLLAAVGIVILVVEIVAAVAASRGEFFRIPLTIEFIK